MERASGLAAWWKAGLDNWQHFALALSFPILLYLSFVAESLFGSLRSYRVIWVDLGIASVLVLAGIVGVVPYRRRKVTIGQTFFGFF
jgi:NO-binding membrane sensor protein with MHYT domain